MTAPRLVAIGVSVRALAASAHAAGWQVDAIDAFGDLDLARAARWHGLHEGWDAARAARRALAIPGDAIVYGSNFENLPTAVARLADSGRLLGNRPATLARVRDPLLLARTIATARRPGPRARVTAPPPGDHLRWLAKPRHSGGGQGIAPWSGGSVGRGRYLQERVEGPSGSALFVADGRRAVLLGLTRQLVGRESQSGAGPFRYGGSLLATRAAPLFRRQEALATRAAELAQILTAAFGLVGVNGFDFVAREGAPWVVEVNPRWTAAMELLERRDGEPLFAQHVAACRGTLPDPIDPLAGRVTHGKVIIYASARVTPVDSAAWLADPDLADIPLAGVPLAQGQPVCTVLARGADGPECRQALAARVAAVRARLVPSSSSAVT